MRADYEQGAIDSAPLARLECLIKRSSDVSLLESGIYCSPLGVETPGLRANRYYFSRREWAKSYLDACHRDAEFVERWGSALGDLDGKIVVDVGCGPGNVYASLGGKPALLVGVDVALGSLRIARDLGYTGLLADAHCIPLVSGFADIVVANACLHHCDDMEAVLREAARLVRPGGLLVTDHDPQRSAYAFRGLGLWIWKARIPLYRLLGRGGHGDPEEQKWMLATECHHEPGDGVEEAMFLRALKPMGFDVQVYRHNNVSGRELFDGVRVPASLKMQVTQVLSGINPHSDAGAMTLMCIARRRKQAAA